MDKPYLHYAWHLSYFSGKSRAYLDYKGIPYVEKPIDIYTFTVRAKRRTQAAVMPVVVTPTGEWLQDTSVIIDELEQRFPVVPIVPATPVQRIAAYLIELWADEWWLPVAMYTRWLHPENYPLFEHDAGTQLLPRLPWFLQKRAGAYAANQMRGHLPALGLTPEQAPTMDRWTRDMLDKLEAHFAVQPFLFGTRPSLADFGLIGPMYGHLSRDPWSKRELVEPRRALKQWVERMTHLKPVTDSFAADDRIADTLTPVFRAIFNEMLPMLEGILAELRAYLPRHTADGRPVPRGLGFIEFPMGEGRYQRAALPYTLWMLQRLLDVYREMNAQDQAAVQAWTHRYGGERLLQMDVPRLKRVGLRVAPA